MSVLILAFLKKIEFTYLCICHYFIVELRTEPRAFTENCTSSSSTLVFLGFFVCLFVFVFYFTFFEIILVNLLLLGLNLQSSCLRLPECRITGVFYHRWIYFYAQILWYLVNGISSKLAPFPIWYVLIIFITFLFSSIKKW